MNHPAGVAAARGRRRGRELARHGHEGGALDHLLDQLACAVHGLLHAADAGGLQVDFTDQILRLGRRFGHLTHGLIDLALADAGAVAEAAADQFAPADLGAQLLAEGGDADPALFQEVDVAGRSGARLAGHVGDFLIDFGVADLELLELGQFSGLQVLVDQVVQRLLLDGADVFLGRLHLGHGHQHQHPLAQVEAGDDAIVDRGDDAVGQAELRRRRRALRRFLSGGVQRAGGRNLRGGLGGGRRRGLRRGRLHGGHDHKGGQGGSRRVTHQTHRQS